ncbi:ABC transporter permease [Actinomyces bowdenii]|uniref:ABC transporter permease n=1 Tax=Actinomyces bowdenii TaxID=131109 RepID=UPI001ABC2852|nr:ABC transporter permease [Actinomyces bowdenii]MBO3723590.1 ABC transporter permease [Actinomyces bowdenii]
MPSSAQDLSAPKTAEAPAAPDAPGATGAADRAPARPTGWRYVTRRLAADRWALAGGAVVVLTSLIALLAPLLTRALGVDPYSYHLDLLDPSGVPRGPLGGASTAHPLGVEPQTGRDLLAIVIEGTRTSLSIGLGATALSMLVAIVLGLSAGYLGGWWDALVARLTDITLGFPHLVLMIAVSAIIPATAPRVPVMILIIGLLGWPSAARVLRSRTLAIRSRTFVQASRAMGAGGLRILTTQVLPNLMATIIVFTTISIPARITAEAALSFLGVGVAPPTPSWGRTIGSAISWVATDPWYLLVPGTALFLVTLAFNLFGDGLRDALDPRTGEQR